jgi:hypothetical protein
MNNCWGAGVFVGYFQGRSLNRTAIIGNQGAGGRSLDGNALTG